MTIHVPFPMTALADQYGTIHQSLAAHRHTHRDWVALGGGTGFLKYRIWPGEQSSTTTGGRLLSQASFPFGVEYAKQIKGTVTKIADCGHQDATTRTGRLSVTLATTFSQGRAYTLLPASSVTTVEANRPCLLSEQGVDTAPLMAQVYRSELQGILPTVDRKAAALVTLKPAVTHIWNDLQEPLLLDEAEGHAGFPCPPPDEQQQGDKERGQADQERPPLLGFLAGQGQQDQSAHEGQKDND